jgi:hypothetical protein
MLDYRRGINGFWSGDHNRSGLATGVTIRNNRTANDQTLGRQPGSLKKRRRSLQDALQGSRNCPHDQSPVQRFHYGIAAFPATPRAAKSNRIGSSRRRQIGPGTGWKADQNSEVVIDSANNTQTASAGEVNAEVNGGFQNSPKETITGSRRRK